jgi:predicted nucleic acid-binding protein
MMNTLAVFGKVKNSMVMKTSLFVDTSGWANLIERKSSLHRNVSRVYQQAIMQHRLLVTTNYIISELVALLASRSRTPRQEIVLFVDALKTTPHVEIIHIDIALDNEAWQLLKRRMDKDWSLVDASSFVVMARYGMMEALTTDHHFTQAGFVRLPAL